jgi:pterin-4a-carbinolamine dehydratase
MKAFINKRLKIDNSNWDGDAQAVTELVNNIFQILDELKYHPDVDVYYNSSELCNLETNLLDSINDYALTNEIINIAALLNSIYADDVLETNFITPNERYFYWDLNKISSTEITTSLIAAAFNSLTDDNNQTMLISIYASEFLTRNTIPVIIEKYNDLPILRNLNPILSVGIHSYITEHRTPRIYEHNPKHGEIGHYEYAGASKLYCSVKDAEHILKYAIGLRGFDELFYFDKNINGGMFLKFRYNGNQINSSYHAFHIEHKDEYEQVPVEIRRKFR